MYGHNFGDTYSNFHKRTSIYFADIFKKKTLTQLKLKSKFERANSQLLKLIFTNGAKCLLQFKFCDFQFSYVYLKQRKSKRTRGTMKRDDK